MRIFFVLQHEYYLTRCHSMPCCEPILFALSLLLSTSNLSDPGVSELRGWTGVRARKPSTTEFVFEQGLVSFLLLL